MSFKVNVKSELMNREDIVEVSSQDNSFLTEVYNLLKSSFVKVIPAPSSTTLTDEQVDMFKGGVFVNGTFLDYKNPVFFPSSTYNNREYGLVIGQIGTYGTTVIGKYQINQKVISITFSTLYFEYTGRLTGVNGKNIPQYPADTGTFTLKCVNGVLTWVEEETPVEEVTPNE